MKDKLVRIKRKRVDWLKALNDLNDPEIEAEYLAFLCEHKKFNYRLNVNRLPSKNRAAYNVLKRHYSTTAMLRYRYTGSFL